MEYTRYWKITIEHDTNKDTSTEEYDNVESAANRLVDMLTDEERMDLFHNYCVHCGTDNPGCQCWNDE
jgi:hypothetical protein